jgi:ribosomal protein L32
VIKPKDILTAKFIAECVNSGMTSFEIAEKSKTNARTVRWYFKKYKIDVSTRAKNHVCWNKGTSGVVKSNGGSFIHGHEPWNKGIKTNRPAWNSGKEGFLAGDKHWNWKGGITDEYHKERSSLRVEENKWRRLVFKRDSWTCQECNIIGGKLIAHHICGWKKYPGLRFRVDNGQTLCASCHKKTDNYCGRANRIDNNCGN